MRRCLGVAISRGRCPAYKTPAPPGSQFLPLGDILKGRHERGIYMGSFQPVSPGTPGAENSRGSSHKRAGLASRDLRQHLLVALALGATFLAYARTLGFDFVYDDRSQIVLNPFVHSWRFVPRYFTSQVWSYLYPHVPGNYYRPLFLVWLRINDAAFGLNPWPWHLMCVLLHVGVTFLVYLLARRLAHDAFAGGMAALIFGLHPVHVEAVAYVSAVPETLNALLLLSSFLCVLRWREAGESHRRWLVLSLFLYASDTLTKETALVLPLLIIGQAWIFPSRVDRAAGPGIGRLTRAIRLALPYLAVTLVYLFARVLALKGFSHSVTYIAPLALALTLPSVVLFYLKLLCWPAGLSAFYDLPIVARPGFLDFILPALVIGAIVLALGIWSRRTRGAALADFPGLESRAVIFASLWLALPLLPVLNLRVFPADELVQDRYLYLPSVGFTILIALAYRHLRVGRASLIGRPAAQALLPLALAAVLGAGTVHQSRYWSDEYLLFSHSHEVAPRSNMAEASLAAKECERKNFLSCIDLSQQVLARDPGFWRANMNLAYTYYELGKFDEAAKYFRRGIASNPTDGNQYVYLGMTLLSLGHPKEAEADVRQGLLVRPNGPNYHYFLGLILKAQGDLSAALAEFQAELTRDPGNERARAQAAEIRDSFGQH